MQGDDTPSERKEPGIGMLLSLLFLLIAAVVGIVLGVGPRRDGFVFTQMAGGGRGSV